MLTIPLRFLFCVLLLAAVATASAQPLVIRADRMLDVESGEIVRPAVVVVEDGRIQSVNPAQEPAGAETIDLGDVTLLPGLMDMHTHLMLDLTPNMQLRMVTEMTPEWTIRGVVNARTTLMAGVASIEHGSMLSDEAIALMKERGTYLVPTTYLVDGINLAMLPPPIRAKGERVIPLAKESLRRAIAAGVPIAFGTDGV